MSSVQHHFSLSFLITHCGLCPSLPLPPATPSPSLYPISLYPVTLPLTPLAPSTSCPSLVFLLLPLPPSTLSHSLYLLYPLLLPLPLLPPSTPSTSLYPVFSCLSLSLSREAHWLCLHPSGLLEVRRLWAGLSPPCQASDELILQLPTLNQIRVGPNTRRPPLPPPSMSPLPPLSVTISITVLMMAMMMSVLVSVVIMSSVTVTVTMAMVCLIVITDASFGVHLQQYSMVGFTRFDDRGRQVRLYLKRLSYLNLVSAMTFV